MWQLGAFVAALVFAALAVNVARFSVWWYTNWVPDFARFDGRDVKTSEYVWGIAEAATIVAVLLGVAGGLLVFAWPRRRPLPSDDPDAS